ncbi:MAG: ABC transporter permease [Leptospiraceae bacterium]|nr:ABC transporter permease [Leptospiraceae bacterium]MCK6381097.1 ABC transporter permease [Leptospiraceae bacterium]NUM40538.1 ABC transporter permease [Leptospiraceae bacterium]
MNSSFVIRFLFNEIFSKKNYSLQVVFSVAMGVSAIVGINSYRNTLSLAILHESEQLMGGDLLIESNEKNSEQRKNFITSILPKNTETSEFVNFNSMVYNPKNQETTLSNIKAVQLNYPLRGKLETNPKEIFPNMKIDEILLSPELANNIGAKIGSSLLLGRKQFTLIGFIEKEPGSTGNFLTLAPSAIIRLDSLSDTGLEMRGSRIRYNTLLKFSKKEFAKEYKDKMFSEFIQKDLTLYHSTEIGSGARRFITSTLDYMSLLGISALFLGAISVVVSIRANIKEKLGEIAIIKCLGGNFRFYGKIFTYEILILSFFGTLIGIAAGYCIQFFMPNLTGVEFLVNIKPALPVRSVAYGFFAGCMVPAIVILETMIKIKSVSPMYALKGNEEFSEIKTNFFKKPHLFGVAAIYVSFFLFASVETGSYYYGILLSSVLMALPFLQFIAFVILKKIIFAVIAKFNIGNVFEYSLKKFIRPKNDYILSIIGISSSLTILILSLIFQSSLQSMGDSSSNSKANIFVLDIKEKERIEFEKISEKWGVHGQIIAPVIGARLKSINFKPIEKRKTEKDSLRRDWRSTARTREYFLSYREKIYDSETLVLGKFWDKNSFENQISVEKDFAKVLSVGINDTLQFNVQGVEVSGKITNLRTVSWSDMKPNFVVVFSPQSLENAPKYYLSSFRIEDPVKRYEFQKKLVSLFPSATIVDIEKSSKGILDLLSKISGIIYLISVFIILSSFLLFLSSLYISKSHRLEEASLLRILGGKNVFLRTVYAIEGFIFGLFSFLISLCFACGIEYFVSSEILNITSKFPLIQIIALFVISTFTIVSVFLIHANGILKKPPRNYFQN